MKKTDNRLLQISVGRAVSLAFAFLVVIQTASPRLAFADDPGDVSVELKAQKIVVKPDAQEVLLPADQAAPGETLLYAAIYKNHGAAPIKGLVATVPIPAGMEYVAGSAKPAGAHASVDGVNFQSLPLKHKIKSADGTEHVELVPLAQYRKLRWDIGELAPGVSVTVSARATISRPQP